MTWLILAFMSAVFSAVSTIFEKKSLFSLDALNFSYIVSIITLVFSVPFFFAIPQAPSGISLLILFIKTVLAAAAFLFVMMSLKNLELSEALPLLAVSPAFVAVLAFLFIGDELVAKEWIGIFLIVAGTYVLELKKQNGSIFDPFKTFLKSPKYVHVLTAVILFTITALMDRILLKNFKLPPYTFMAYQQLFYALFFVFVVASKRRNLSIPFKTLNRETFILILLVAGLTIIYRYTQIEAVKLAPVALVLAVKRLSVLIAIIVGGRLFKENNVWRRVIATIIILAGISLIANSSGL